MITFIILVSIVIVANKLRNKYSRDEFVRANAVAAAEDFVKRAQAQRAQAQRPTQPLKAITFTTK